MLTEGRHPRRASGRGRRRGARKPIRSVPSQAPASFPELELTIERPAHGGSAVAHDAEGRVIFVRHAIPGETVRARVTFARKNLAWAEAVEILSASDDRIPSVWSEAGPGGVGGAELAHVSVEGQRRWKESVVADQLRRIGGKEVSEQYAALPREAVAVRPTDEDKGREQYVGWRSRMECVIDEAGRPCMHGYRDDTLIPLSDMPLAMPELLETGVLDVNSVWSALWKPGDRIRVAAETGVENPRVLVAIEDAVYEADGTPAKDPYLHHRIEVGQKSYVYRVRMQGFWQAHRDGAQTLARTVAEFVRPQEGQTIVELYSGAGLFSAVLADGVGDTGSILTVEGSEEAVEDSAFNTADYGNVQPFVGWIDEEAVLSVVGEAGRVPDTIVLDPPRAGAGREVCERIASIGAERVVLVSCDVAAGARDLKAFVAGGYRIVDMRVWDLYPYTHHVECVVLLTR